MEKILIGVFILSGIAFLAAILYASHIYKNHPEQLGDKDRPE